MKLLVLGSSNSIGATSFIGHLMKATGIKVTNWSVGASSSTAGLYSALSAVPGQFDVAMIDYEINEEGARKFGLKSDEDIRQNIRSLGYLLRERRIIPLLAIMPTLRGAVRPTRAEQLHIEVCEQDGIHYFNIAELFRRALPNRAAWLPLMRNDFHMGANVTPVVGQAFHAALEALNCSERSVLEWAGDVVAIRSIAAGALMTPERRILRSSGHRAGWHARLREGKRLIVPVGGEERLLGLLVNSGCLGGNLGFKGAGPQAIKHLTIYFGIEKAGWFISVMVDMKQPLRGTADGIEVELLPPDLKETEMTLHQQPFLEGRYGEIEIEAFLVGSRMPTPRQCTVSNNPTIELDLIKFIDQERFGAQVAQVAELTAAI